MRIPGLRPPSPAGLSQAAPALLVLICTITWGAVAFAQNDDVHLAPRQKSPTPVAASEGDRNLFTHVRPLRVDVDLVLVPVSINDAMNHPVMGLQKHNFELYEGTERQQIQYFSTEDAPVSIGVILDISKSMSNKTGAARDAVTEYFGASDPEDDYFVITFSDKPRMLADVTRSIGYIQEKLATAEPNGHTALLDAIYLGMTKLRSAQYKRRALLIISDGGDNCSRYRAKEIRSIVQEGDVEIYAIGLFDSIFRTPEEWAGKRLLTDITEATGGRTVTLGNARKLPEVAREISRELRSRYVLGYRPTNVAHDGTWRKIRVRLTPAVNTSQMQVYSRKGYQAPSR